MAVSLPVCPLLSSTHSVNVICLQETCAWYMKNYKKCSIYLLAHNAALDISKKQEQMKNK